jgi:hypothetical protein
VSPRAPWGRLSLNPALTQLFGKSFPQAVKVRRTGIEPAPIKPLGLNRQMDVRAGRVGMEGHHIIMIVAQLAVGNSADSTKHRLGVGAFGHRKDHRNR